jgi:hypothetical protein
MSVEKEQLRQESDDLMEAVDDVRRLERRRRTEAISTPRFHELGDRIEERSRDVFRLAQAEESTGNNIETSDVTIEDVAAGTHRDEKTPDSGLV